MDEKLKIIYYVVLKEKKSIYKTINIVNGIKSLMMIRYSRYNKATLQEVIDNNLFKDLDPWGWDYK